MRILTVVITILLLATATLAQAHNVQTQKDKTTEEIQKLFADLNEAITKKDRAVLERVYADEFQYVRPSGAVINKTAQIEGIIGNDALSSTPIPIPPTDRMLVYGDVVVLRNIVRGTAVNSIIVKKDGRWQLFQAQGTRLAPERNPIKIDAQLLDSFLGKYEFGPGAVATVTREGDILKWRGGNRMPVTLVPLSDTYFFAKESETEMTFIKDDKGRVMGVVLKVGSCQESRAKKIE